MNSKIVSAKIQGNSVYLYDKTGNYISCCGPAGVTPVSAYVNGNYLVMNTSQGKVITYELRDGCSPIYQSTR